MLCADHGRQNEQGTGKQTERYTRLLEYDVSTRSAPVYVAEYVVPLPLFNDPTAKASKNPKVAAQSELHALPNGRECPFSPSLGCSVPTSKR